MIAWKSIVSGLVLIGSTGLLPSCQSVGGGGTFTGTFETPLMRITIEVKFYPLGGSESIDLDMLKPKPFTFDGKNYFYYPTFGGVLDPDSGQLYQLDDPSWENFRRLFRETPGGGVPVNFTNTVVNLKGTGILAPIWDTLLDPSTTTISITVNGSGNMVLPYWDVERWPTLDRKLFVFQDGIEGSPDPMNIEVSGEASDVFGYLAEFGLLDIETVIDGSNWSVVVDENNGIVDVFVDGVLVTSVSLTH